MSKIREWMELASVLKRVKAEEAELRREMVDEIIADKEMRGGRVTNSVVIDGYKFTAVKALSYRLDKEALATIWTDMSDEDKEAISLVPTLQVGPYKKLGNDSVLHEAVTSSIAMSTLKAEEV